MRARSLAAWKALTSVLGVIGRKTVTGGEQGWLDEILLLTGLTLVTVALWPLAVQWIGTGLPALLVPGAIVIWLALPTRAALVAHQSMPEKPIRRTP